MILLDTNILIYSKLASSPHYSGVTTRILSLISANENLIICPQVIYEFFFVATKPIPKGGLGLSTSDAIKEINDLIITYKLVTIQLLYSIHGKTQ